MAIDQRDVSSTLRFMDDRALQQYAAMHKNDPYIFPLAFQESQNRQRLRMSQQGAQGMQPQPKVADQALAQMAPQMLPEEQGIGALPAQNMQGMADGGIAGYDGFDEGPSDFGQGPIMMMAEGGHVPRYQGNPRDGSLVRVRGPYDQPPASMTGDIPGFVAGPSIFQTQPTVDEEEPFFRRLIRERKEVIEAKRVQEARVRAMKGQPLSAEDQARIANADKVKTAADTSAQDMAQFDAASNLYMTERAAKQAAAKPAPVVDNKAPPPPPTVRQAPVGPRASAVPEQTAAQRYAAMQKSMGSDRTELDKGIAALGTSMRATAKDELEDFDKEVSERGPAFKGREERLAKREEGLSKRKDETMGLALLEAGLAIMSTPGSLATAIGKGAQVGLKTYSAGLKDLRAAQEKLDDSRDQIEEFRRNEDNMTAKERRQFKTAIGRTETEIQKLGVQAAEKMYGYGREDAKAIFTADTQERLTDKEIAARKDIATLDRDAATDRANAPTSDMREAMLLGTGNTPEEKYLSGLKVKKELMGDKQGTQMLKLFLEENARREKNMEKPLTLEQFRRTSAAFFAPPAPVDTTKPTRP